MASLARTIMTMGFLCMTVAALVMVGCDNTGNASRSTAPVTIKGTRFFLEIAADNETRTPGLGRRTHIDDDGGMIFCFPFPQPLEFVMRDCPIPIDIIFTDGSGRALSTHAMKPEDPRGDGEGLPGDLRNPKYEARLAKYPSKYPAQFAIELKAGTIEKLGVKEGDKIEFDAETLKKLAR